MSENFDLLGDPIPENWGKRGRPPHIVTEENRIKVMMLLAIGRTDERIAAALGITKPTLKKHYFRELQSREDALERLKASHLMMLYREAANGNASCIKQLGEEIRRLEFVPAVPGAEQANPETLGKKAQADADAKTAHEATSWKGLLN